MPRVKLEKVIQQEVLDYMNACLPRCRMWRQNTGGRTESYKGKNYFVRFGRPGACDLTGTIYNGTRIEVEIKRPGEKPTERQRRYIREMQDLDCIAFWVDDVEQVPMLLEPIFSTRRWQWKQKYNPWSSSR